MLELSTTVSTTLSKICVLKWDLTAPSAQEDPLLLFLLIWDYGEIYFEGISLMHPTVHSLMLTLGFFGFPMYYLIYLLLLGDSFQAALSESVGTSKSFNPLNKQALGRVGKCYNTSEVLKHSGSCQCFIYNPHFPLDGLIHCPLH